MHLTIIKADNTVGVDGKFLSVDCAALPVDFHALQWDGPESGIDGDGEIEWNGKPKPANTEISDLGEYYAYVEAWRAEKARSDAALEAARLSSPAVLISGQQPSALETP